MYIFHIYLGQFNGYRNKEKPPKFMEKGNLEVLLFTLQSKMRAHNKVAIYLPIYLCLYHMHLFFHIYP